MRAVLLAVLVTALALTGCSGGDDPAISPGADPASPRPVRGDIEVDIDPLTLADLDDLVTDAPEAGTGVALLGDKTYTFAATFCDANTPVGSGEGEGMTVAWDIRPDDDDHRVAIRILKGDARWVRADTAEAEWDPETRTLRFAGAFVPFRAEDGKDAVTGGLVLVCPAAETTSDGTTADETAADETESAEEDS